MAFETAAGDGGTPLFVVEDKEVGDGEVEKEGV